jgi:hypothetical protein
VTCPRHQHPHRLGDGQLAAGRRDASFWDQPGMSFCVHVALEVPSGRLGPGLVPACNTTRAYLAESTLQAATEVPAASRCQRPACVRRYTQADNE